MKCFAVRCITVLLILTAFFVAFFSYFNLDTNYVLSSVAVDELPVEQASKPFFNIFSKPEKPESTRKVFLGGMPIGFTVRPDGVIVVGFSELDSRNPAREAGIAIGDIISEIEGSKVDGISDIDRILNDDTNADRSLGVKLDRKGRKLDVTVKPVKDKSGYRLGVFAKESTAGLGTVTYITQDGKYGALGHPITENESRLVVPVKDGTSYKCDISGYSRSAKGAPGSLRGFFLRNKNIIGTVEINNTYGIFGRLHTIATNLSLIDVCPRGFVKMGKAKIVTTIADKPEEYDIEIVRKHTQSSARDKGMVVRVTDNRLLSKTGGILQGMSGSPIVQNGKLVGAITHVMVNDPLCGYGMYADFMLEQSDRL